ncbi:uncharacterized protein LOC144722776 [Lampetra planeri]
MVAAWLCVRPARTWRLCLALSVLGAALQVVYVWLALPAQTPSVRPGSQSPAAPLNPRGPRMETQRMGAPWQMDTAPASHAHTAEWQHCGELGIGGPDPLESPWPQARCRPRETTPEVCEVLRELFRNKTPASCHHQRRRDICVLHNASCSSPHVVCADGLCSRTTPVSLGLYREAAAAYRWLDFEVATQAAAFINADLLPRGHGAPHPGFCLLRCVTARDRRQITQLLILPPALRRAPRKTADDEDQEDKGKEEKDAEGEGDSEEEAVAGESVNSTDAGERLTESGDVPGRPPAVISVNVLLLDSVSRHHFYRSLPKTVAEFRRLNEHGFKRGGRVLDFQLLQGIKSRTQESLQALLAGEVNEAAGADATVRSERVFRHYKRRGYETLYLEDMCWLWDWGLVRELGVRPPGPDTVQRRRRRFRKALTRAGIDRVDISYSSCVVLAENGVRDVFHGPDAVCFNGLHHHAYLLRYVTYFVASFAALGRPALSFTILDTAHEDTGLRLQGLDADLAEHVRFLAHPDSTTFSLILADHGNTYGRLEESSPAQAWLETFQPAFFAVVPDAVAQELGADAMRALGVNQRRLVSLLDVHQTLRALAEHPAVPADASDLRLQQRHGINRDGLLSAVPAGRTCEDIPRIQPNVCICRSDQGPQHNDSYFAMFAEVALMHMNEILFAQQQQVDPWSPGQTVPGLCQRLVALWFDNVQTEQGSASEVDVSGDSNSFTDTMVRMDIYVRPGLSNGLPVTSREKFAVSVLLTPGGGAAVRYERLTPFSRYAQCAHPRVDPRLCVCDSYRHDPSHFPKPSLAAAALELMAEDMLSARTERTGCARGGCLCLFKRQRVSGVALEVVNACKLPYALSLSVEVQNLVVVAAAAGVALTTEPRASGQVPVPPGTVRTLLVAVQGDRDRSWQYKYNISYVALGAT